MIIDNVFLEAVGVKNEQYPTTNYPEIAFAGKSNVGKSTLINTMINRKALARTSQNPGKTRTINFYNVEEAIYFVDLPGYGYAKISKSESAKWGAMIEDYLLQREHLEAIFLLIDIRHEPGENDKQMFKWIKHYNRKMIVVATKADKIKRSQLQKNISIIRKSLGAETTDLVIPFSGETKQGRDEIWQEIQNITGFTKLKQ